jgi:hypothetical protein
MLVFLILAWVDETGQSMSLPCVDALTLGYALSTHCLPCGWHLLMLATLRRDYETLPRNALLRLP